MSNHSTHQGKQSVEADLVRFGWFIVFTASAINVVMGSYYSWSVIGKAISKEWGWTQTQASLPFALITVSFSLAMIFAGRLQDRIGPRFVAIAGGLMFGGGMILSSFFKTPGMIALTYGLLGGAGIAVGYSGTVPVAMKWFPPQRKGLVTGIVVAGVGMAALLNAPLANWLVGAYGIQGAFRIMGVGTVVIVVALGMVLRNPPERIYLQATRADADGTGGSNTDTDWMEVLKTPQFYGVWFMYVLSVAPVLMIIANSVQILSYTANQKFNPVIAPILIVSFSTAGRILGGYISDLIGRRKTLIAAFLIQALNIALLSVYETQVPFIGAFVLSGLVYGAFFALLPAIMADFYGLKNLGVNYGMIGTAFGVSGVLGTQLGGYVGELLKSFDQVYWMFGGMLVCAAVMAFLTRTPRR